jgi:hypothetical protein
LISQSAPVEILVARRRADSLDTEKAEERVIRQLRIITEDRVIVFADPVDALLDILVSAITDRVEVFRATQVLVGDEKRRDPRGGVGDHVGIFGRFLFIERPAAIGMLLGAPGSIDDLPVFQRHAFHVLRAGPEPQHAIEAASMIEVIILFAAIEIVVETLGLAGVLDRLTEELHVLVHALLYFWCLGKQVAGIGAHADGDGADQIGLEQKLDCRLEA